MGYGGKRTGAGRKPNPVRRPPALRKAAADRTMLPPAVVDQIAADGPLPLDIMLKYMREIDKEASDAAAVLNSMAADQLAELGSTPEAQFKGMMAKVKQLSGLRLMAHAIAKDAAPYLHASMKAAEGKSSTGDRELTQAERLDAIARADAVDSGKVIPIRRKAPDPE